MSVIIKPKKSTVAGKVPTAASLELGEIVINFTEQKMYGRHPDGMVMDGGAF